jgi:hypothetical protein
MRLPMLVASLASIALLSAAAAETTAVLHENAPGRAGVNRHRLHIADRSGGDSRLLAISCRVDEPGSLGVAIDFATGKDWQEPSRSVALTRDDGATREARLATDRDFLIASGASALDLLRWSFAGRSVQMRVVDGPAARFELDNDNVRSRLERYRALCKF